MSAGPDDATLGSAAAAPRPEPRVESAAREATPADPQLVAAGPPRGRPPGPSPRPRIVDEPGILGLSRIARSRFGSRLFTWFFVLVYMLIIVQMIYAILDRRW